MRQQSNCYFLSFIDAKRLAALQSMMSRKNQGTGIRQHVWVHWQVQCSQYWYLTSDSLGCLCPLLLQGQKSLLYFIATSFQRLFVKFAQEFVDRRLIMWETILKAYVKPMFHHAFEVARGTYEFNHFVFV